MPDLRELLERATAGPWNGVIVRDEEVMRYVTEADLALIALTPDLARLCAEQDDLIRRFSEWDMLWVDHVGGTHTSDAPYWQGEIAKMRAKLFELEVR